MPFGDIGEELAIHNESRPSITEEKLNVREKLQVLFGSFWKSLQGDVDNVFYHSHPPQEKARRLVPQRPIASPLNMRLKIIDKKDHAKFIF